MRNRDVLRNNIPSLPIITCL